MARYKLIYFRGRARAELVRLIFHAAGEEFEDVQVDENSWQQIKTCKWYPLCPWSRLGGMCVGSFSSLLILNVFSFITASPTGSLPMLINNENNEQLVQSMSIARYVAQEFGESPIDVHLLPSFPNKKWLIHTALLASR